MNVLPAEVLRTLQIADRNLKAPAPSVKLRGPGWKSVCAGAQVFGNNCVNCPENIQQKRALESALFAGCPKPAFAANCNEAISASRTGTTCAPWRGRTSCARPRASRG